jgi:hypothetical protein
VTNALFDYIATKITTVKKFYGAEPMIEVK